MASNNESKVALRKVGTIWFMIRREQKTFAGVVPCEILRSSGIPRPMNIDSIIVLALVILIIAILLAPPGPGTPLQSPVP
jgi:hypothetical protein